MRTILYFAGLLGILGATRAAAGTITGTVRAVPPQGAPDAGSAGAYDSRKWKFVEKIDYQQLRDFVVYVDQPVTEAITAPAARAAVTTQKDASFEPHVLPVAVGTTVRWPNQDDIFHNVFSMAEAKEFDLGFYKNEKVPDVTFDKVGRVDVFCAIHTKMHCIILVVPNRFFASVDAKNHFAIKDLPAGTYRLRAWHERLPSQVKEITVPADGEVNVDFTLGLPGQAKP